MGPRKLRLHVVLSLEPLFALIVIYADCAKTMVEKIKLIVFAE